jgi:hypothetical protein
MNDVLTLDKIRDLIKDKNSLCYVYDSITDSYFIGKICQFVCDEEKEYVSMENERGVVICKEISIALVGLSREHAKVLYAVQKISELISSIYDLQLERNMWVDYLESVEAEQEKKENV